MSFLLRVVETAEEVICVSALAAILGAEVEQAEPEVGGVIDAVQDYRDQTLDVPPETWIRRLMYSSKILGWLSGDVRILL